MDNVFAIEITDIPPAGGATGEPSVLRSVNEFLSREPNCEKVNGLLQEDGCIIQCRSLIDCVLAELVPRFKDECFEFYEGKGTPLVNRHPPEMVQATDVDLGLALEVLVSGDWASWDNFKSNFKREMKWEPL